MAEAKIEWCDYKWEWNPGGGRVVAAEAYWRLPYRWDRAAKEAGERRKVFCASLADVFEDPPELAEPRMRLFKTIGDTPNLDWLLLTKRPELWRERLQAAHNAASFFRPEFGVWLSDWLDGLRPVNVWVGTTAEDQARADERRIPLINIPAHIHFVSYEPALEQVDWSDWVFLDWMIMGGESGAGARALQVEWLWASLEWCRKHAVAPFVKQLGVQVFTQNANALDWPEGVTFRECGDTPAAAARVMLRDHGEIAEFPTELRVREFPAVRALNTKE